MPVNKLLSCCLLVLAVTCSSCGHHRVNWKNGTYSGELSDSVPSGYGEWVNAKSHLSYRGFWDKGVKKGMGSYVFGDYKYIGHFLADKYSGYGELYFRDSLMYAGHWRNGVREGKGVIVDSCGRRVEGVWTKDTIIRGSRSDSSGTYSGSMNVHYQAQGHGRYLDKHGNYYEGLWKKDKRSGFGFTSAARHHFRAGEWKNNRYLGERILYTSERIYGIDISKYQHEHGRRKYAIAWSKLKIIHLGTISKKKVHGNVNYPISFIYIKSTEGISLHNKYYLNDYHQARKHGFRCGAYHFFSVHSDPAKQAYFFLRKSAFHRGDFPPVLDVEPTHKQIAKLGGTAVLMSHISIWMRIVENRLGVRPVLYVSQTFVNRYLVNAPAIKSRYKVWIARYGEYKPDVKLIYWQLCPDGYVRGVRGTVDINVFNGYHDQLKEFVSQECIK